MTSLSPARFHGILRDNFPFQPTSKQDAALGFLAEYILTETGRSLFLLKGYAGTGKTTLIGTLVTHLWHSRKKAILLAPTGRAAKVMSSYSQTNAYTIHKKIYFPKKDGKGGVKFVLAPNKHRNTVFIVDEASMIPDTASDNSGFGNNALLDDLLEYVFSGHKCKLILIGDTAQLPPVKLNISPALDADLLKQRYDVAVTTLELDEVMRQTEDSGILHNATRIRMQIGGGDASSFGFDLSGFKDIIRLSDGYEIQDAIDQAYNAAVKEESVLIVRSNKRANLYNQQIRSKILFHEHQLAAGDYVMVVKNNYFWLKPDSIAGFIANGDILEILEIFNIQELYGFNFAKVKVKMVDYPKQRPFETVLLLDTITAETPSLSYESGNKLYQAVKEDYQYEKSKYKKFLAVKNNPYFNALQVKFAYAVTCHKAQGGQWDTVFVEQPYLANGIDIEYLRWLYTAVTRARERLYLIGFRDDFFV